jgi:hypothetical protein
MKSIKISLIALLIGASQFAFAQSKTETFGVNGKCGMCKSAIEKAAKSAGATEANWNKDSKQLTVTFAEATSSVEKIQQAVADAGYDNVGLKSTDAAYGKLPGCCKYDRGSAGAAASASAEKACDGKCKKGGKCDGKCEAKEMKAAKCDGKCDSKGKKCDGSCKKK